MSQEPGRLVAYVPRWKYDEIEARLAQAEAERDRLEKANEFQMGAWARSRYGHGWSAWAQAKAAHRYYLDSGWSGWECA